MMKQQILLLLLFINIFLSSFCHSNKKIEEPRIIKKPNVIFIVADDLGFSDVGFRNNNEIHTPNINEFAQQGMVLENYYVQDVCSPSRATFMTGRFPLHNTIVDWIPPKSTYGLPLNETTMADKFKSAGYITRAVGKWHLGFYKWGFTPTFRGFDSFLGFYSGGEDYFTHESSGGYDFRIDGKTKCGEGCSILNTMDQGNYSTTVFSKEAVRVIEEHDTNHPLFLYLAYQGVHSPGQVPESYVKPYENTISSPIRRTFAGMLSAVDEGIGNVTNALKQKNMYDNSLFIFTSDNGGPTTTSDGIGAINWPLRGGKHSIWEGGTRAISVISTSSNSNLLSPHVKGKEYHGLMHGVDWLPTLSDIAGYDLKNTLPLDGVSQWKAMNDVVNTIKGTVSSPRNTLVYGNATDYCPGEKHEVKLKCGFAIRYENFKLIKGYGGTPDSYCNKTTKTQLSCFPKVPEPESCPNGFCLYDVINDPFELNEISSQHGDIVDKMKLQLDNELKNYHQYSLDENCPKHKFKIDKVVGKYWNPWC